jgi:branched-chain amino acid transport system substrate-binding protein
MTSKKSFMTAALFATCLLAIGETSWAGQYGPGASDTEIKIGNTVPYSGLASAYGTIGKPEAA